MWRRRVPDDLPDGVVPLPRQGAAPGGCGLTGCLYVMMAVSALLLAVLIAFALLRGWPTPAAP